MARTKTISETLAEELDQQKQRIARHAAQMKQVGKEAVGDLRQTVKTRIMDVVRKPIKRACEKFVEDGDDIGRGVKDRVIHLFENLARHATKAAEAPAVKILEENFSLVRADIKSAFEDWGDPIQQTADLILQRERQEIEHKSQRERDVILVEISKLLAAECMTTIVTEYRSAHA